VGRRNKKEENTKSQKIRIREQYKAMTA